MLSICYEGIAIPLFWRLLKKAASTTAKEQIELLSRFVNTFGKNQYKACFRAIAPKFKNEPGKVQGKG
jgi:hypothetical protein